MYDESISVTVSNSRYVPIKPIPILILIIIPSQTRIGEASSRTELSLTPRQVQRSLYSESNRLRENGAVCCGVLRGAGWSERALNELPVTLRFTSILHELSTSNRLGIAPQHWLTCLFSFRPDTQRDGSDHTVCILFANTHTHTHTHTCRARSR